MVFGTIVLMLIATLLVYLKSPQGRGMVGELFIRLLIGRTHPGERYVINNLLLRTENGKTSQIDHVVINPHGVFVIETKNYSGRIYGAENRLEWTQVLNYGRVKNKLYNPLKQNQTHIYHISKVLTRALPIESAVVFVQGNIQFIDAPKVFTPLGLRAFLKSGMECLTVEDMETAYQELIAAHQADVSNREHVQNIQAMQAELAQNICPRCGKTLVTRQGKNGAFWGCSGYPKCRFTKRI